MWVNSKGHPFAAELEDVYEKFHKVWTVMGSQGHKNLWRDLDAALEVLAMSTKMCHRFTDEELRAVLQAAAKKVGHGA